MVCAHIDLEIMARAARALFVKHPRAQSEWWRYTLDEVLSSWFALSRRVLDKQRQQLWPSSPKPAHKQTIREACYNQHKNFRIMMITFLVLQPFFASAINLPIATILIR